MERSKTYLKYEESSGQQEEMNVFRNRDRFYAETDEDYDNILSKLKEELRFDSAEECIAFYKTWFNIYKEVRDSWDEPTS